MIRIVLGGTRRGETHWSRIAGEDIAVDQPISQLAPFTIPDQGVADAAAPFVLTAPKKTDKPIKAWAAGTWRDVSCVAVGSEGYFVTVEGIGAFAIRADGGAITFQGDGVDESLIGEAMLGPALTVALALRGTYCWHASSLLIDGEVVALMGESRAGKSTLAEYLARHGNQWARITDDVLPVRIGTDAVIALPHFPQLKLGHDQQIGQDMPAIVPLRAIVVIEAEQGNQPAGVEMLTAREAASVLVKHTLATSLFDARMLATHMEACTVAASRVAVKRLIYPHVPESLPQVLALLKR